MLNSEDFLVKKVRELQQGSSVEGMLGVAADLVCRKYLGNNGSIYPQSKLERDLTVTFGGDFISLSRKYKMPSDKEVEIVAKAFGLLGYNRQQGYSGDYCIVRLLQAFTSDHLDRMIERLFDERSKLKATQLQLMDVDEPQERFEYA